jgi:hypothetical protein
MPTVVPAGRHCRSRWAPADLVEGEILAAISELALPDAVKATLATLPGKGAR